MGGYDLTWKDFQPPDTHGSHTPPESKPLKSVLHIAMELKVATSLISINLVDIADQAQVKMIHKKTGYPGANTYSMNGQNGGWSKLYKDCDLWKIPSVNHISGDKEITSWCDKTVSHVLKEDNRHVNPA